MTLTVEDDLLKLLVILSFEDVLVEWAGGPSGLLIRVAPLDALRVQLNNIGRLHAQVKATHAVLSTGAVLQYDVIAASTVTSAPGRNGVRLYRHLRVAHSGATFSARGLRLDEKGALVLDGKVACPGDCRGRGRRKERKRKSKLVVR